MSWWVIAGVLAGWAAIVAWRGRQDGPAGGGTRTAPAGGRSQGRRAKRGRLPPAIDPDIDREELEAAEREVKDLDTDVRGRPLEDTLGDDWGPGVPKPPYV